MWLKSIDGRLLMLLGVVLLNNLLSLRIMSFCSISKRNSSPSYSLMLGLDLMESKVFFLVCPFYLLVLIHAFLVDVVLSVFARSLRGLSLTRFWFRTGNYKKGITLDGKNIDAFGDVFGVSSFFILAGMATVFGRAGSE